MINDGDRGKFYYKGDLVYISSLKITGLRDEFESPWGVRCPLCRMRFVVGDDCRTLYPLNMEPFENTMIHTACVNQCGGLVDACQAIEYIYDAWKNISGIWHPVMPPIDEGI